MSLSNLQRGNLMEVSVETSLLKTRFPTQLHVFLHLGQTLSVWSDASSRVQWQWCACFRGRLYLKWKDCVSLLSRSSQILHGHSSGFCSWIALVWKTTRKKTTLSITKLSALESCRYTCYVHKCWCTVQNSRLIFLSAFDNISHMVNGKCLGLKILKHHKKGIL